MITIKNEERQEKITPKEIANEIVGYGGDTMDEEDYDFIKAMVKKYPNKDMEWYINVYMSEDGYEDIADEIEELI